MTNRMFRILLIGAICTIVGATVFAQDSRVVSAAGDKYVISARAGGVNYTEGRVAVFRSNGTSSLLVKGDELQIGEQASTDTDGRAEVLLNPGSYVRIGGDTEFAFVSTALDDLQLDLKKGTAMFEVIADDDFRVSVRMPKTEIGLVRSGVYRIDVLADGTSKITVSKGKAFVGAGNKTEVKAGRSAQVDGASATVTKSSRDDKDALEIWSKDRAKELTKANASLQRRTLRDSLINSFNNSRGWNMYDSFGLWVFDPLRRGWCFMPFGSGWGSPYGFWYGYDFWNIGMPRWIYYQAPPVYYPPAGTAPKGGTAVKPNERNPGPPDNGDTHGRLGRTPAFMKIENNERGSGAGVVNRRIDLQQNDNGMLPRIPSMPSSSRSSSAPPTASQPTISLPNSGGKGSTKEKP